MLNISLHSINDKIRKDKYSVFKKLEEKSISKLLLRLLILISILSICSMFLPWTQNIRSKGYVTTLSPLNRPQDIQSLIAGKIENWHVLEGDVVSIGDTIITISESKEEYLDPELLKRTQNQINAKNSAANAYQNKTTNLDAQIKAAEQNKSIKLEQNNIKNAQFLLKIKSDSLDLIAAQTKLQNVNNQLQRTQELYTKGIKSLTELENKKLSVRESEAKINLLQNKLQESKNEITNIIANQEAIITEYEQKVSKIRADKNSTLSQKYTAEGESNKLQSSYNKYKVRTDAYVITSPINGTVTKSLINGVGEYIKAGQAVATIIPTNFQKAVELYVKPVDVPLLKKDKKVMLQFDGWPAVIFSGWPNNSFGTFGGRVFAIDNDISENGKYRVLVVEDPEDELWPELVRVGGGANGLLLLNEVKVYYEIWRQLNGFPPDFYQPKEFENTKNKAPIRKIK